VATKVLETADDVCRNLSNGFNFSYAGQGELGLNIQLINVSNKPFKLQALDSNYLVEPMALLKGIPNFVGNLCV